MGKKSNSFLLSCGQCKVFFFIHHQLCALVEFSQIWIVCSAAMHFTVSRDVDIC